MTITLSTLIYDVREKLSSITTDMVSDEQVFLTALVPAQKYIDAIKFTDYDDDDFETQAIIALAVSYLYDNYTSLVSIDEGDVPEYSDVLASNLRKTALAFLKLLSQYPLNSDLTIDTEKLSKMKIGTIALADSIWSST